MDYKFPVPAQVNDVAYIQYGMTVYVRNTLHCSSHEVFRVCDDVMRVLHAYGAITILVTYKLTRELTFTKCYPLPEYGVI